MPTYPTYDGRMPLTRDVVNALAAQTQANSRRGAGREINLSHVGSMAYQNARGRAAVGVYGKLTRGTALGGVTYYDWIEQDRRSDGTWADHQYPLGGNFADGPAVEKTNRPGVLGEVVFLRRVAGDLATPGHELLWIFDSTFAGVWGTPDPFSSTGGWSTATPRKVWDWGGPTSVPSVEDGNPGGGGRWYTPAHPAGTTQQWVYETLPFGTDVRRRIAVSACQFIHGVFSLRTDYAPPFSFPPFGPALTYDSSSFTLDGDDPLLGDAVIAGVQLNVNMPTYANRTNAEGPGPFLPPWDFTAILSLVPSADGGPSCSFSRYLYGYPAGAWHGSPFFPFDWFFTPNTFGLSAFALIPVGEGPLNITVNLTAAGPNPVPGDFNASGRLWLEYPYDNVA